MIPSNSTPPALPPQRNSLSPNASSRGTPSRPQAPGVPPPTAPVTPPRGSPHAQSSTSPVHAGASPRSPPQKPPKPTKPAKPNHLNGKAPAYQTQQPPVIVTINQDTSSTTPSKSKLPWQSTTPVAVNPPPPPPGGAPPAAAVMQKQVAVVKDSANKGFTLCAHNLGYASAILLLVFGIFTLMWAEQGYSDGASVLEKQLLLVFPESDDGLELSRLPGYYCLIMSILVYAFEYSHGLTRSHKPQIGSFSIPLRGIVYLICSVPCFFAYPSMLPGTIMLFASAANFAATASGERISVGAIPPGTYCLWSKEHSRNSNRQPQNEVEQTFSEKLNGWMGKLKEDEMLSQVIILAIYTIVNVVVWMEALLRWQSILGAINSPAASFGPFAKAFGQMLNFNCSVLLFPVLRAVLRGLNNFELSPTKPIAAYLPLRKNIIFHKFIALVVCFAVVGHVSFHYINFTTASESTHSIFAQLPWYTGFIITVAMVLIFCGAQARVKRAHYELFWFSHHWFIVFFAFLLAHGPVFWQWSMIPVLLYVSERVLRNTRGTKPFLLNRVSYTKPVVCLEFFPQNPNDFVFREGQYLYVMVPSLSKNEWHPFTISSAYDDLVKDPGVVTLHIRVQGQGSWTSRLREYLAKMAPDSIKSPDHWSVELSHLDSDGKRQRGKHMGPDGYPLICIDGPHAAPAQHYSLFSEVMLVGAGIGLTPAAAIIQAVLRHKWKKGFRPETIYFYWVVRHSEVESFQWFIRLLCEMQKMVASDRASGSLTEGHRLEIHIFVTSAPKGTTNSPSRKSGGSPTRNSPNRISRQQAGVDVDIGFDEETLTNRILNPVVSSKELPMVLIPPPGSSPPTNKFQDIFIWNGRPDWAGVFQTVKLRRNPTTTNIGVCFCGAAVIGKTLKQNCRDFSSFAEKIIFNLFKENF